MSLRKIPKFPHWVVNPTRIFSKFSKFELKHYLINAFERHGLFFLWVRVCGGFGIPKKFSLFLEEFAFSRKFFSNVWRLGLAGSSKQPWVWIPRKFDFKISSLSSNQKSFSAAEGVSSLLTKNRIENVTRARP